MPGHPAVEQETQPETQAVELSISFDSKAQTVRPSTPLPPQDKIDELAQLDDGKLPNIYVSCSASSTLRAQEGAMDRNPSTTKTALRQSSVLNDQSSQVLERQSITKAQPSKRNTVHFDIGTVAVSSICQQIEEVEDTPSVHQTMASFSVEDGAEIHQDTTIRKTFRLARETLKIMIVPKTSCSPHCVQNLVVVGGISLTLFILLFVTWISLSGRTKDPCELRFCTRIDLNESRSCGEEKCAVCDDANGSTCHTTQHNKCAPESWSRYPKCHRLFQTCDACGDGMTYKDNNGFYCGRNCTISHCLEVVLNRSDVVFSPDCSLARCNKCRRGYSPNRDASSCIAFLRQRRLQ